MEYCSGGGVSGFLTASLKQRAMVERGGSLGGDIHVKVKGLKSKDSIHTIACILYHNKVHIDLGGIPTLFLPSPPF